MKLPIIPTDFAHLLPGNVAELANIVVEEELVLEEEPMFTISNEWSDRARPEVKMLQEYFRIAKHLPDRLITQNHPAMQEAYKSVSRNIWTHRVTDLELALQSSRNSEKARRDMVTRFPAENMPIWVTDLLNQAFMGKYEELILRVKNDFQDFFPYHIASTSPKIMVLNKMTNVELIDCVMKRF
jgi:hypothetical protein